MSKDIPYAIRHAVQKYESFEQGATDPIADSLYTGACGLTCPPATSVPPPTPWQLLPPPPVCPGWLDEWWNSLGIKRYLLNHCEEAVFNAIKEKVAIRYVTALYWPRLLSDIKLHHAKWCAELLAEKDTSDAIRQWHSRGSLVPTAVSSHLVVQFLLGNWEYTWSDKKLRTHWTFSRRRMATKHSFEGYADWLLSDPTLVHRLRFCYRQWVHAHDTSQPTSSFPASSGSSVPLDSSNLDPSGASVATEPEVTEVTSPTLPSPPPRFIYQLTFDMVAGLCDANLFEELWVSPSASSPKPPELPGLPPPSPPPLPDPCGDKSPPYTRAPLEVSKGTSRYPHQCATVNRCRTNEYKDVASIFERRLNEQLGGHFIDTLAGCSGSHQLKRDGTLHTPAKVCFHPLCAQPVPGVYKYSGVICIHNARSAECLRRCLSAADDANFLMSQSTGKVRWVRYAGPPGGAFLLGSENCVYLSEPIHSSETDFQCMTDWLTQQWHEAMQEHNHRQVASGNSPLPYSITPCPLLQILVGDPTAASYALHNDCYSANTAPGFSGYPTVEAESGFDSPPSVSELPGEDHAVSRSIIPNFDDASHDPPPQPPHLPTSDETMVTTFTQGSGLFDEKEQRGLVSVSWKDAKGVTKGTAWCGNDTIHLQLYFAQTYFRHQVVSHVKCAPGKEAFRVVVSMRPTHFLPVHFNEFLGIFLDESKLYIHFQSEASQCTGVVSHCRSAKHHPRPPNGTHRDTAIAECVERLNHSGDRDAQKRDRRKRVRLGVKMILDAFPIHHSSIESFESLFAHRRYWFTAHERTHEIFRQRKMIKGLAAKGVVVLLEGMEDPVGIPPLLSLGGGKSGSSINFRKGNANSLPRSIFFTSWQNLRNLPASLPPRMRKPTP